MSPVVLVHAASSLFLVGLIWTVQVVHYPLFSLVGADGFTAYEAAHSARITWVIMVPWAIQGLTTLALLFAPPDGVPRVVTVIAAALAAVPVLVTIIASVPAHAQLADGFDAAAHARLVGTNWLRTVAWTAHGAVAVWITTLAARA